MQTISMKQVGNLTEFVREHMLDETSAPLDIAKILDHYADLLRAHELVQEARRQLDKLEALRRDAESYDRALARIESSRAAEDAMAHEAEQLRARLLEAALAEVRGTLPGLRADRGRLTDHVRQAQTRVTQNEIAIATHGGAVLKEAEHELELARSNRLTVTEAAAEVQRLAALLDIAPLDSVSDYPRFADALVRADADLAGGEVAMRNQAWETERSFREATSAVARNREEHRSARTAASNVPRDQRMLRDRLCAELGLKVTDLPYVAELLTINQEHDVHGFRTRSGEPRKPTDWEPAAERLMRPFALSLLVAQQDYDRVSAWVDDNDLRGRLEYHPVPAGTPVPTPTDPRSIAAVVEVRPNTFATAWLTADINRRYDHIRVEAAAELRQHRKAVTPSGQIKDGTRHIKDDRRHLTGPANYVLGWNTAARREALETLLPGLEAVAIAAKRIADASRIAQNQHGERVNAVNLLRQKTADLNHIDLGSAHDRVTAAEEMVASFASDADLAHYLTVKQRLANELHDLDHRRSRAESEVGAAEKTESDHHDALTEVRQRLDRLVGPDLDKHAAEALAEALEQVPAPRTLGAIGAWQRDVSRQLADRATSAQATRERAGRELVGHMKDFTKEWPLRVGEIVTTDPESRIEFLAMRDRIARDDLPRFEDEFRTELETNAIHHLARFSVGLEQDSRAIAERIDVINSALRGIDYRPGTFICLERDLSPDSMVREFRAQLEAITGDTMLGDDEAYAEIRFLRVKELLDRFAGREGFTTADANWTAKVTDVRNWFEFSASERARLDNTEVEHYQDSGGKSGGQKEKLAYTVLAASLSYQYGLAGGRTDAFRFVMIDEAFGRGSEDSTRFGLELFDRLGLQLLTVTPLQKIHIIEQYVNALAYVRPVGTRGQLISMPIEEYRARRRQGSRAGAGRVQVIEFGDDDQSIAGDLA
ncbi:ATP-binding protein [Aeromicrobium sp. UC242_57]|uniref:ATP-binding protein n=1 Tax=Aeromicrobium sp. UC242_57 TaxID=3374624 RepID=UPI0037BE696C